MLAELGFALVATRGTAAALAAAGVPVTPVNKVREGRPHIVDMIKNDEIALVINTVEEKRTAIRDSYADPPRGAGRPGADVHDASPARAPRRSACRHARARAVCDAGAAPATATDIGARRGARRHGVEPNLPARGRHAAVRPAFDSGPHEQDSDDRRTAPSGSRPNCTA